MLNQRQCFFPSSALDNNVIKIFIPVFFSFFCATNLYLSKQDMQ